MKPPNPGRRSSQIAAALGAMLMTASCTAMSSGNPATRADPAGAFDGGVGQLLRYCGKLRTAGDLVTAAGLCERAHRLDPANPEPLMQLAGILTALGDLHQATKVYQTLIATSPDHVEARYELAKTYIALTQYDLALSQLQAALRYRSDDPRIYNALGIANGLIGAHETAEEVFQAGLAVAPDNPSLRNNLGLSLVLSGRYDEGIAVLEELAARPAAAETSQQNLQLAYGLASAAKAEAMLAEVEPPADPAPGNTDDDGALIASRRSETADEASQDEDRNAVPWADPIYQRAEVGIFEDTDPLGGGTNDDATPPSLTEPAPSIHDPTAVLRADDGTGAGAPSDPPSERFMPTSVQTAELAPRAAVDAGPPVVFGDYLTADANLEDPAAEDTAVAEVPAADIGATQLAEADPAAAETAAEGAPATRVTVLPAATVGRPATGEDAIYTVQLGSYRSEARARRGWEELAAAAAGLLEDVDPVVRRADLGPDEGIFYRLRTAPATKAEADMLCGALRARGIDCLVIKEGRRIAEIPDESRPAGL